MAACGYRSRRARYAETPYHPIETGMIFTLEPGVMTGHGSASLEDEVVLTSGGHEWFSRLLEQISLLLWRVALLCVSGQWTGVQEEQSIFF